MGYRGGNSAAVHEAASALSKDMWRQALKNPEPEAILLAGGSGSGKTTAVNGAIPNINDTAAAVLDGNLSKLESAYDRIEEAVDAGKVPLIYYVYRDPVDAWVNGVVKRMLENPDEAGRVVPLSTFLENTPGSLKTAKQLKEDGLPVLAIDNSRGPGNQRIMSDETFNRLLYPNDLRAIIEVKTKELLDRGTITKKQYEDLIQ